MKWLLKAGILLVFINIEPAHCQDSSSIFQVYTPSVLLKEDQVEVKIFNNLYTQTAFFDENSRRIDQNTRATYFTGIGQLLYGFSSKTNAGLVFLFRSVRIDTSISSPLAVFKFEGGSNTRTALSSVGPTIRFAPFKKNGNLSVQSTLLFPVSLDLQGISNGKPFLDFDKYLWWTQLFYDKLLPHYFLLFAEADLLIRVDRKFDLSKSIISTPLKVFIGKFLGEKWGIYSMVEWAPFWGYKPLLPAFIHKLALVGKYQLLKHLELELLYTIFPFGKNQGAGKTCNLGIRYIRW